MAKSTIVAGIELGSTKIASIIAQVNVDQVSFERSISIVGVASVESRGIRKGQIVDIEEAVDATVQAVEAAERMAGYNLDKAYVALNGAHINSQNSQGVVAVSDPDGEITDEDVARVIEAASAVSLPSSRELVHVLPREFTVDGETQVLDPIGMSGVRLEVQTHLVTASGAALKNLRKAINEVGVDVLDFVYTGYAASEATLTKTEKELGSVLVDIGGGTTCIAVFIDGSLAYSGVLPIGAKNVTNDLAIGLRVSLESAEKIKLALSEHEKKLRAKKKEKPEDELDLAALGVSDTKKVSYRTLSEGIIRPRLNEIFTMVRLQLERENLATRVPSGVVLVGGGAETVGAVEAAKRMMSLPVRVGKPKGVGGLIDDVINPAFATPIGLIIYGSRQGEEGEGLTTFTKRFKLPTKGIAGRIVDTLKDLLP